MSSFQSFYRPGPEALFQALDLHRNPMVLCVDLDFTLLRSSSLYFFFPKALGCVPKFLWEGPRSWPAFKAFLAQRYPIEPRLLPYRPFLVDFLRFCRKAGIPTILATGAHHHTAERIAEYLGCFQDVIASSQKMHCVGKKKAQALLQRYSEGKFWYLGDSRKDEAVWRKACGVVALDPSMHFRQQLLSRFTGQPCIFLYDKERA